jgi:hypothetical protein
MFYSVTQTKASWVEQTFFQYKGIIRKALKVNEVTPSIFVYTGCVTVSYILWVTGYFTSMVRKTGYRWLCKKFIHIYKDWKISYCLAPYSI